MNAKVFWDEWKRVTRFFESTRIALRRENDAWAPLHTASEATAKIIVRDGSSTYEVDVLTHRATVQDASVLCSLVLIHSYGLVERAAEALLGGGPNALSGGVEAWGTSVLQGAQKKWADVKDGKAGLVEVSVVRNHIAHGSYEFDQTSLNRIKDAGGEAPKPGAAIVVNYHIVDTYRARLKSFLRIAGYRS